MAELQFAAPPFFVCRDAIHRVSTGLESHAEPIPEFVFHLFPSLACCAGEIGTVLIEQLRGILGLVFVNEALGFLLDGRDFIEGLVFETGHVAEQSLFGAAPLHGGQFVGLAVVPNPGFLAIAQLTAFVEPIRDGGAA